MSVDLGTIEVPSSYYVTATTLGPTDTTCVSMTALTVPCFAFTQDRIFFLFPLGGTFMTYEERRTSSTGGLEIIRKYDNNELRHVLLHFTFNKVS
ncbi:hypothetical protein AAZX31_02G052400 [Glycine max]